MTGVTWQLAREAIVDVPTALLGVGAAAILFATRINSGWLILGGGAIGLAAWFAA